MVSNILCWIGLVFEVNHEVDRDFIGNDGTGSCITVSVRKIIFRAFFLTMFFPSFFFGNTSGSNGNFSEFPIGYSIFPAEISTNENLGNSTNELPQSLFQLANYISPYRSNESVRTIYAWHSLKPFLSSNQIQTLTFLFSNLEIVIFASAFIVTGRVYLVEYRIYIRTKVSISILL